MSDEHLKDIKDSLKSLVSENKKHSDKQNDMDKKLSVITEKVSTIDSRGCEKGEKMVSDTHRKIDKQRNYTIAGGFIGSIIAGVIAWFKAHS